MVKTSLRPLVLIGPSGVGKSTVAEYLSQLPSFLIVPTVTTRPARSGENTFTHTFVDQGAFDTMREQGKFIGTTHIFGHNYGLPKLPDTNDQIIVLLRAPFVEEFRASYPHCLVVQLEAPITVLQERLIKRGNQDRADPAILEKELLAGRSIADAVISTEQPINCCVDTIVMDLLSV